jgi:hypothetical protein
VEIKIHCKQEEDSRRRGIVTRLGFNLGTGGTEKVYEVAEENLDANCVNRSIVLTDGDFNLGLMDSEPLKKYLEKKWDTVFFFHCWDLEWEIIMTQPCKSLQTMVMVLLLTLIF